MNENKNKNKSTKNWGLVKILSEYYLNLFILLEFHDYHRIELYESSYLALEEKDNVVYAT